MVFHFLNDHCKCQREWVRSRTEIAEDQTVDGLDGTLLHTYTYPFQQASYRSHCVFAQVFSDNVVAIGSLSQYDVVLLLSGRTIVRW